MPDGELCGVETPNGPCTMVKGHEADFHRHRIYKTIAWTIRKHKSEKILRSGTAKVPMLYAIGEEVSKHGKIVIEVETV